MSSVNSTANTNSTSATSTLSGINGIGGLATGIDTDTLVASLTSTEQSKIDKQNQQVQTLEWQQDAYREIIKKMQSFQSKYLDVTSATDITRSASFNTISATVSSSEVSVKTNSESYSTSFTINRVEQIATGRKITSAAVSGNILGSVDLRTALLADDYSDPAAVGDSLVGKLAGKSISATLDGTTKVISFDESFADAFYEAYSNNGGNADEAFLTALEAKFNSAFGEDRVSASFTEEGKLLLDTATSSGLTLNAVNSDTEPLELMGLTNGMTNKISTGKQLSSLIEVGAFAKAPTGGTTETVDDEEITSYAFKINGVEFKAKNTSSLQSIMNEINNSTAGVEITYSEVSDSFTMTSKATGVGSEINLEDADGFLAMLGLTSDSAAAPVETAGTNAVFYVDGQKVERDNNTNIHINGLYLSLEKATDTAIEVKTETDTSSLKDLVTNFVNDYNEMIEMINKSRTEEKNKDYAPLTDAQKEAMSDKQIEQWEEKAKAGILRNDSTLNSISSKLSSLMYTSFNGFSLYEMGVQSAGYTENGKLTIDEDKLDAALSTKSEKVKDFFLGESGFGAAMKDAVNSAIKTSGPKGSRGSLIEKAGIGNTMSDTENNITERIKDIKKYITTLQDRLKDRQEYWWSKFSALETLVSNMNSYSSIIGAYTAQ